MIQAHRKAHATKVLATFGTVNELKNGTLSVVAKKPLGNTEIERINKLRVEEGADLTLKRSGTAINISCK